jgi:hypothetical protein
MYRGCPLNAHRSRFLATAATSLLTLAFQSFAFGNPQAKDTGVKQIEVRLIPKKKTIKAGENLEVRVEIWNVGLKPLFINTAIFEPCSFSPLSLRLELGPPMKPQPGRRCFADCVYGAKDTFASRFVLEWNTLSAHDFYGTVVTMNPDSFPQLNTPGRWRLRGAYKSMRDLSLGLCFDAAPLSDEKEQVKALPWEAWQGEVDTNTVWIEVVRGGNSSTDKK